MTELTPQQHLDTARQGRLDGKVTEAEFHAAMDRWGPQLTAPRAATEAERAADDATAELAQLRQRRLEGKVGDDEFFREVDRLGRLAASPGTVTRAGPDGSTVTMPAEVAAEMDAALDPPAQPSDYQLNYEGDVMSTPEGSALDASVRQALHSVGIPQVHAGYMIETVDRLAARFENASEHDVAAHCVQVAESLQRTWGAEYDRRKEAVLDALQAIEGPLGNAIEAASGTMFEKRMAALFADPLLIVQISDALERRAARKGKAA